MTNHFIVRFSKVRLTFIDYFTMINFEIFLKCKNQATGVYIFFKNHKTFYFIPKYLSRAWFVRQIIWSRTNLKLSEKDQKYYLLTFSSHHSPFSYSKFTFNITLFVILKFMNKILWFRVNRTRDCNLLLYFIC